MIERRPIVDREQWLEWRRQDVTASAVGALFGEHPYNTRLRLFHEKRGLELDGGGDSPVKRRGRWFESAVAAAVTESRPDWQLTPANIYLRDAALRIGASPDFFVVDSGGRHGIMQAKTVAPSVWARPSGRPHFGWNNGEEVPRWIILQARTEMMLDDAQFGVVAGLLHDPHRAECFILELQRDAAAEKAIAAAVADFWADFDAAREPEPDYYADAEVIAALRRKATAGVVCDLTGNNEIGGLLALRATHKLDIAEADAACKAIEARVKFIMGDAETAIGLPDWRISFKQVDIAGYTVKPKSYRKLTITDRREEP